MNKEFIPIHGSMSRPANPETGLGELKANLLEWKGGEISITYSTDEFTSVCPTTGQPDFNQIVICYVPKKKYVESKAMKFYLWAFREYGVHCEYLADMLCNSLFDTIDPSCISVTVNQKARGGLQLSATSERSK
jgi:7-cyano-7-deazaguanine reductase